METQEEESDRNTPDLINVPKSEQPINSSKLYRDLAEINPPGNSEIENDVTAEELRMIEEMIERERLEKEFPSAIGPDSGEGVISETRPTGNPAQGYNSRPLISSMKDRKRYDTLEENGKLYGVSKSRPLSNEEIAELTRRPGLDLDRLDRDIRSDVELIATMGKDINPRNNRTILHSNMSPVYSRIDSDGSEKAEDSDNDNSSYNDDDEGILDDLTDSDERELAMELIREKNEADRQNRMEQTRSAEPLSTVTLSQSTIDYINSIDTHSSLTRDSQLTKGSLVEDSGRVPPVRPVTIMRRKDNSTYEQVIDYEDVDRRYVDMQLEQEAALRRQLQRSNKTSLLNDIPSWSGSALDLALSESEETISIADRTNNTTKTNNTTRTNNTNRINNPTNEKNKAVRFYVDGRQVNESSRTVINQNTNIQHSSVQPFNPRTGSPQMPNAQPKIFNQYSSFVYYPEVEGIKHEPNTITLNLQEALSNSSPSADIKHRPIVFQWVNDTLSINGCIEINTNRFIDSINTPTIDNLTINNNTTINSTTAIIDNNTTDVGSASTMADGGFEPAVTGSSMVKEIKFKPTDPLRIYFLSKYSLSRNTLPINPHNQTFVYFSINPDFYQQPFNLQIECMGIISSKPCVIALDRLRMEYYINILSYEDNKYTHLSIEKFIQTYGSHKVRVQFHGTVVLEEDPHFMQ